MVTLLMSRMLNAPKIMLVKLRVQNIPTSFSNIIQLDYTASRQILLINTHVYHIY